MFLGLDVVIWIVLTLYFVGMLVMGWWCKRSATSQEGYLLGNRRFGLWLMVMHAFGAGTNPGDAAGTVSKTVSGGASGIWVSWMWMFGTPFYWLIAPVIRRMRCLTMADYYQERYGNAAALLYTIVAGLGMMVFFAGVLLATTRTVQGMMGKAALEQASGGAIDWWFFGILFVTTITFSLYGYWGGIVAAIRTDMVQGLMIIVLSFLAIPMALNMPEVGGLSGLRETLGAASSEGGNYLSLFDSKSFKLSSVILLCINAPLTALALPHLMSVCAAGKTEWEGRMGFVGGNMLKRICTIGWSILGLCWLAYLIKTGAEIHPDAAFGDSIRSLLSPALQGIMLACVMAASMSSGDAFQVTVAGLFTQSVYRVYINRDADDHQQLRVTRFTGLVIVGVSLVFAILMRSDVVKSILMYFNILGIIGISTAMGILWRRMNTAGVFASVLLAGASFIVSRYVFTECPSEIKFGLPILAGVGGGIVGSLLSKRPDPQVIDEFFKKIYVPIGEEEKLDLPLDEAVPVTDRLCTAGGLFLMKPSKQTWLGFLVILGMCIACVLTMLALIS
ncbi:MAG: sodium:solute symporter family protein [Kiritimatiellia bacterium]|jgi:Na+/proline symporter|nr:sodium:solute symporter family protein [Kiritimatiellia bacterium]